MSQQNIPYQPFYIQLFTLLVLVSLFFTPLVFSFDYQFIFEWGLTIVFSLFPIALKLAAPRIPFWQAIACSFIVVILNYLSGVMLSGGSFILWYLLSKAIQIVCVSGFGFYWVRCNYIPSWANKW